MEGPLRGVVAALSSALDNLVVGVRVKTDIMIREEAVVVEAGGLDGRITINHRGTETAL